MGLEGSYWHGYKDRSLSVPVYPLAYPKELCLLPFCVYVLMNDHDIPESVHYKIRF